MPFGPPPHSPTTSSGTVQDLEPLSQRLARTGREFGLFPETAAVRTGSNLDEAWAWSELTDDRRGAGLGSAVWRSGPRGVAVDRSGAVMVFEVLPRDMLGTPVNQPYLTDRLTSLLRIAAALVPADITKMTPAAAIDPIGQAMEGDPAELGRRSGSSMRMNPQGSVRTEPDVLVDAEALPAGTPEIAGELAARLLVELRARR